MRQALQYSLAITVILFCQTAIGQIVLDPAMARPILTQGSGGVLLNQFTSITPPSNGALNGTVNTRIIDSISARGQRFDLSGLGGPGDTFEITGFRLLASGNNTADVADDTLEFAVYTGDVLTVPSAPQGTYSITSSEIASFGTGVSLIGNEVFSLAPLTNGTNNGDFVTANFATPIAVSAAQANDLTFFAFSDALGNGGNNDFEHLEGISPSGAGRLNFSGTGIGVSGPGTGNRNFNFQVLGNIVSPVPEPTSTTLLGIGCVAMIGRRRRR